MGATSRDMMRHKIAYGRVWWYIMVDGGTMYHWYIHDGAWQSGCQVIFSRPDRWGDGLCQISTRCDDDPNDHIDGCGGGCCYSKQWEGWEGGRKGMWRACVNNAFNGRIR